MKNGIYAARKSGERIDSIFIDEERLEIERQNRRVEARRREQAQAAANECDSIQAEQERQNKKRRQAWRYIKQQGKLLALAAVVFAGQKTGYVALEFAAPSLAAIFALMCFRAGCYFGKKSAVPLLPTEGRQRQK